MIYCRSGNKRQVIDKSPHCDQQQLDHFCQSLIVTPSVTTYALLNSVLYRWWNITPYIYPGPTAEIRVCVLQSRHFEPIELTIPVEWTFKQCGISYIIPENQDWYVYPLDCRISRSTGKLGAVGENQPLYIRRVQEEDYGV
jgi:hypothetical protein